MVSDTNRISGDLFCLAGRLFALHHLQDSEFQEHVLPADHGQHVLEPDSGGQYLQGAVVDHDHAAHPVQEAQR